MPQRHSFRIKLFLAMKLQLNNDIFFAEVERLLLQGEQVTFKVRGFSMMPWLRDGRHSVVIARHSEDDIRVGNILFFLYRDKWVMHRLHRIEGERLCFAGDGNYKQWEWVERDAVRGVVKAIVTPGEEVIYCDDFSWRFRSKVWLMLPAIIRRYILALIKRLKL